VVMVRVEDDGDDDDGASEAVEICTVECSAVARGRRSMKLGVILV